jgi:hypothetical protein
VKLSNTQLSFARFGLRPVLLLVLSCLGLCASLFGVNLQGLDGSFKALTSANGDILGVTTTDAVALSTDGGVSFSELRAADGALQAVATTGDIAIVGGDFGRLLRADLSVDATAWTEVASGASFGAVTGIVSDGSNHWLAVTDSFSGDFLRSTDNGLTWTRGSNPPGSELNAVSYDPVSGNWITVGGDFFDSAAFYSTDGISWQSATGLSGGPLYSLAVDSAGTVVAVGEGVILRSVDGGETYTAISDAPTEVLKSVVAVADGVFIAVGFEGLTVEIAGSSATILRDSVPGALTIDAVIAGDGAALISGVAVVTAPSIDPNGGNFSSPVTVTLSVPSGTQVYYTIDGSLPSDQSILYTQPFLLEASATVRVVAVASGISSAIVSADFVVAATNPVFALQISVIDPANFLIELPESQTALSYQLQSSTNLVSWAPLQSVRAGSGGALTWTVPIDGTSRFYRVLIFD